MQIQLERYRVNRHRSQPDHMLASFDLRRIRFVSRQVMWFEMTVKYDLCVMVIRLVGVRRGERHGEQQERQDDDSRRHAVDRSEHVAIMVPAHFVVNARQVGFTGQQLCWRPSLSESPSRSRPRDARRSCARDVQRLVDFAARRLVRWC